MQWARIAPDAVIVATAERAWLHTCRPVDLYDPFAAPMPPAQAPGDAASTARLLDGALGAGVRRAPRQEPPPPLTMNRWIWRLVSYYHLTTHTPNWMRQAAAAFTAAQRPALARWAMEKADDEAHHDRLALKDLEELGVDGAGLVAQQTPPTAAALLRYFEASVADPLPLDCIGYAHTVERFAIAQSSACIDAVRAVLPSGSRAWRSLKMHSNMGSDASHVDENVQVIATLPPQERARIALACHEVAKLLSSSPVQGHRTEAQLEQLIGPWRHSRRDYA